MNCPLPTAHYCCLLPLLLLLPTAAAAQCDPKEYARIFAEAQQLQETGRFIEAKNTYEAAKVYACKPQEKNAADAAVDRLFEQVERLRRQADSLAWNVYANDLAFKSQTVLRDGDLTSAFRLADFAYRFVDSSNIAVRQSLYDILYRNDLADTVNPLFWTLQQQFDFWSIRGISLGSFAFSPDSSSRYLLANAVGNKINLYGQADADGKPDFLEGHDAQYVVFSPDGKHLASAAEDGTIRTWDLNTLSVIRTLNGSAGRDAASCLAYFPDGKRLAACAENNRVHIWNLDTGEPEITLAGHREEIRSLAISKSGRYIATTAEDTTIRVYDAESAKILSAIKVPDLAFSLDFSPDERLLVAGLENNCGVVYDWEKTELRSTFRGGKSLNVVLPKFVSNDRISAFSLDETVKTWDLKVKKFALTLSGHTSTVTGVAFSPDGKRVATGSHDFWIRIWDAETGEKMQGLDCNDLIYCLDYSPDGQWLATGLYDSTAQIWDLRTGKIFRTLKGHNASVVWVDFSPDGKWLATASQDSTVRVWDTGTGRPLQVFRHTDAVERLAFSPDGRFLAAGQYDTIIIWDPASGKAVDRLGGKFGSTNSVAFSPDSRLLGVDAGDGIQIWDLNGPELLIEYRDPGYIVTAIAFSPDGRHLAIGNQSRSGSPGVARMLSLESGKILFTLDGHSAPVYSLAFSPDGKKLVTGSGDDLAKIWRLDLDGLLKEARRQNLSALSKIQLQDYALGNLLDLRPQNEALLLQTRDIWQIDAFAELYADRVARMRVPVKADYERALRLYRACLESGVDNENFGEKISELEKVWKKKTE